MVQQPDGCPTSPAHIQMRAGFSDFDIEGLTKEVKDPVSAEPQCGQDAKVQTSAEEGVRRTTFPNVQVKVKNTFIDVKDSGEPDDPPPRPARQSLPARPRQFQHHRCVSEPVWVVRPSPPNEPMSLSQMSSVIDEDGAAVIDNCQGAASEDFAGYPHGRHLRQLSNQSTGSDPGFMGSLWGAAAASLGLGSPAAAARKTADDSPGSKANVLFSSSISDKEDAAANALFSSSISDKEDAAAEAAAAAAKPAEDSRPSEHGHLRQLSTQSTGSLEGGSQKEHTRSDHSHFRQMSTLTDDGFNDGRASHFRQLSTLTADGFEDGWRREPQDSLGVEDIRPYIPDPRLSDPWSMAGMRAAAAAVDAAAAADSAAPPSRRLGSVSDHSEGKDQWVDYPAGDDQTKTWEHPGQSAPEAIPSQEEIFQPAQNPHGVMPVSAGASFASNSTARTGTSTIAPPIVDGATILPPGPMWHKQASVNAMHPTWRGLNTQGPASDAEAMANAAYARGVAAGVAFARGFAAGAGTPEVAAGTAYPQAIATVPVATGTGPRLSRGSEPSQAVYVRTVTAVAAAPVSGNSGATTATAAGRRTKAERKSNVEEPLPCKWFARGTCKFGAECRYLHEMQNDPQETSITLALDLANSQGVPGNVCGQTDDMARLHRNSGTTTISLEGALGALRAAPDAGRKSECQIFWCDQRAFKDNAAALKEQLEAELGVPVKTYRTAEMCTRLLKKKSHWSANSVTRLFLVSWANAQLLVPFLTKEAADVAATVIVLCDTCGSKGCNKAEEWAKQFAVVDTVATTWPQAVEALKQWTLRVDCQHT